MDDQKPYWWSQDYGFIIYDGYILGGLDRNGHLNSVYKTDWDQYGQLFSPTGFRLFKDGEYLDTIFYTGLDEEWRLDIPLEPDSFAYRDYMIVELNYKGEFFGSLVLNDGKSLTFGPNIQIDPSA